MDNKSGKSTAEKIREWIQFALLLIASIWGIYTFLYKEIIVPTRRPASLQISANMEELSRTENLALVRARIHVVNIRDVKIYAPALWFTVTGLEINSNELSDEDQMSSTTDGITVAVSKYSTQTEDLIASWRLEAWEVWYEPDDETTSDYLFYVPLELYDAIQLKLEVIVTKNIDEIARIDWYDETGIFFPTLMMKEPDEQVEPFDPNNSLHTDWEKESGAGHNWFITTFSLFHSEEDQSR